MTIKFILISLFILIFYLNPVMGNNSSTNNGKGRIDSQTNIEGAKHPNDNNEGLNASISSNYEIATLNVHYLTILISIISIIVALLSIVVVVFSFLKEQKVEKRIEKHIDDSNKVINELPDKMVQIVESKIYKMVNDYVEKDLNESAIDFLKVNTNSFVLKEQYKSIALNDIYMNLFTSLEMYLQIDQSQDIVHISETIREHFIDANHLILLFMQKKECVLSGLYYFSENPSAFVNDDILRIIEADYKTDLDIITAIKKVESNRTI